MTREQMKAAEADGWRIVGGVATALMMLVAMSC